MQKSIDVLKHFQDHITPGAKGDVIISVELAQALKDAAEAMDKQIPKIPQLVDTRFVSLTGMNTENIRLKKCYKCPNCDTHIFHLYDSDHYCRFCGQRIDWGNAK